jgi:hypothetical protein
VYVTECDASEVSARRGRTGRVFYCKVIDFTSLKFFSSKYRLYSSTLEKQGYKRSKNR